MNQGPHLIVHCGSFSSWRIGCLCIVVAHAAHIATGAKSGSGTGDDNAAHIVSGFQRQQCLAQRGCEIVRKGVTFLWAVQGDRGHTLVNVAQQLIGPGIQILTHGVPLKSFYTMPCSFR